jgi:hypothetical protein
VPVRFRPGAPSGHFKPDQNTSKTRTFPSVAGFLLSQAQSPDTITLQRFVGICVGTSLVPPEKVPTKYQHQGE